MESLDLQEAMRTCFRLDGEDVIRLRTGETVSPRPNSSGYRYVSVPVRRGTSRKVLYHRLKFFLAKGFLPPLVDHRDRDHGNNRLANLRPATKSQNGMNSKRRPNRSGLPRGVRKEGRKFQAQVWHSGTNHSPGLFDTPELAAEAAEDFRKKHHGDFFAAT